jgi:hypothetical protein
VKRYLFWNFFQRYFNNIFNCFELLHYFRFMHWLDADEIQPMFHLLEANANLETDKAWIQGRKWMECGVSMTFPWRLCYCSSLPFYTRIKEQWRESFATSSNITLFLPGYASQSAFPFCLWNPLQNSCLETSFKQW